MRKIVSLFFVLMLTSVVAFSQSRSISGKVTDQNGEPVASATVNIKGTTTGTAAGADGIFKIMAKTGDVLVVSAVGFQSTEVKVGTESFFTISITRTTNELTSVVVTTALGIQRQAKELGYSTTKVTGKDLVQAKPISVVNGLTGKVSGLQINTVNNGLFAPTRVVLRGNRSLTGNNQPLYVVDGAIFYNDISTLNPEDISDITVLKGSSASAIYGSDASNGVILITTKHGVKGRPTVTFSSTVQMETVSYMLDLQNRFGSNGGEKFVYDFNDLSTYIPYENQSYGPEYNGKSVPLGRPLFDGSLLMVPYAALPNEKRDFFDKAITTQQNFSYQAGDDNSRFFLSAQDINAKSVMPGDKGRRDVFRVGGTKMYGIFSANYSLAYTYLYSDVTNTANVYQNVMNTPAHVPLTTLSDWQNNKYADLNGFYNDYFDNPYWDIGNQRNQTTNNNLTGNVQLNLRPVKWMNVSYRLSLNNSTSRYEYKAGGKQFSTYAQTDDHVVYSNPDGNGTTTVEESPKFTATVPSQPQYISSNFSNFLVTSDALVTVDKDIFKDFNLKATVGTSYQQNKITSEYINAGDLFFPVYNVNSLTGLPDIKPGNYVYEARKLGLFGEATIGFRKFAFVHGSYRTDIDSRLSKDNRWIPYYDIDASLVISDMIPSINDGKIINFIKVRAAHSKTGNASALSGGSEFIAFGAYALIPTLSSAAGFPFNGLGGYQLTTTIADPNLKPESVTENEIGLEFGFWQNRISLSLAAYQSKLKDGIVYSQIARSTGAAVSLVNAANTQNKGFEAEVHGTVIKSKSVTWVVGVNYSRNESKVISINGALQQLGIAGANGNAFAVVGQPYPVIESRDWVRDDAGHVIVNAITGNPTRDANLKVLGAATPKDILGITSSVSWKNLSLAITADYRGGYKIFNSIGQYIDFTGISKVTAATGRQRFVFPNSVYLQDGKYVTNTNVTVDDANFNFWPGLYRSVGANYVTSAAAWKLREVALTYDIPRSIFSATKIIQKATLTLSGRNLIMLRPSTNEWTDPEFSEDTGNGVGRNGTGQAPPTRIYSATLSVTF